MRIDLHVHTVYSGDATLKPEELLRLASAKNLQGVAVTDHNTMRGALECLRLAKEHEVVVIPGIEVRTDRGEVIGYFIQEEPGSREFFEVVDSIREQGGMVAVPHPFDPFRMYRLRGLEELLPYVDAVEVMNARCAMSSSNMSAMKFALEHGLKLTAGSDAHYPEELGSAGVVVEKPEDVAEGRVEVFGTPQGVVEQVKRRLRAFGRRLK
ncbi:MAG: CehA/McbA family metallohydrolase [Euryarchaeota archaeon]|nr:CehA/McbA family metallohydrolase [Euryarchaeota archaeon]